MRASWAVLLALAAATPAMAQERAFCPERPGLDTQACIVESGRVAVETSIADWTRERKPDGRSDTIVVGDTLVRVGVTDRLELRAGWQPFGYERMRDADTGAIDRATRVGDAVVGLKASLLHPDGEGLSIAVLPTVTLPVGRRPIGGGSVALGMQLPLSYDVSDTIELDMTPALRALPNDEGTGHHLRYGSAGGVTVKVAETVKLGAEASLARDEEPGNVVTRARAALSVAWQPGKDWQLDLLGIGGLNRDTPDVELSAGIARRF